jgi:hypothetical protein
LQFQRQDSQTTREPDKRLIQRHQRHDRTAG